MKAFCQTLSLSSVRPVRLSAVLALSSILMLPACGQLEDSIRNWGKRHRLQRIQKVDEGATEQLQRDLNLSRAKAKEIETQMQALVQESSIRGRLAWQLARRFCLEGRYEAGNAYARASVKGQVPTEAQPPASQVFERALPYFQEALAHARLEANLVFDAGLCYANASRALGWEAERFTTAVFLFEAVRRMEPKDTRADYQLALLYGKTTNPDFRNTGRAVELLEGIITRDDFNIPARFALAHVQAEIGDWSQAARQYAIIQEKLRDLHRRGNLPGDPTRSPQFQQAVRNAEQLQDCLNDRAGCQLQRAPLR